MVIVIVLIIIMIMIIVIITIARIIYADLDINTIIRGFLGILQLYVKQFFAFRASTDQDVLHDGAPRNLGGAKLSGDCKNIWP